jgi:hypothetical protein
MPKEIGLDMFEVNDLTIIVDDKAVIALTSRGRLTVPLINDSLKPWQDI